MDRETMDLFIIGGGAAGLSAAKAAREAGITSLGLADRGNTPGGILRQCLHRGFPGTSTGLEYADRLCEVFPEGVNVFMKSTVLSVSDDRSLLLSSETGFRRIYFRHLILATGCTEIPIGGLDIAGTRPAGVYTAGQMQAMMNLEGKLPRGPVVILGSGDLGLIMADAIRNTGIPVTLVEQKETCGGLARNRKCLDDPLVTLVCGQSIREVSGYPELDSVVLTEGERIPCRTLLIAAGLRPDRSVIRTMNPEKTPWMTLCGNCRKVHCMVEAVVSEGLEAGKKAAMILKNES